MAAAQGPGGGGGGLWDPSPCSLPPFPGMEGLLVPDAPSPSLGFFDGSVTQLASLPPPPPPPLPGTVLLGYPQDNFDMFHQQNLAQLAAQPAHSNYSIPNQVDNSMSISRATLAAKSQHISSSVNATQSQEVLILPSQTSNINTVSTGVLQGLPNLSIYLDKPADDSYNWRKYGQKAVKGGEYPKSYYKCTHQHCLVRKNVEHSADGQIIQITYRGQHTHERPLKRRSKDCGGLSNPLDDSSGTMNASTRSQSDYQDCFGKPISSKGDMVDPLVEKRQEGDEQSSGSCNNHEKGDNEVMTNDRAADDANANERNTPAPGQKIIVSTTSEVDLLDDGYKWRKYGQKVVKGNPHPRSYYKCSYLGCDVKKQIERSCQEPNAVITTYEGKHIHDVPAANNSSHAIADTSLFQNSKSSSHCTGQVYRTITC